MVDWAQRFDAPILLHEADRQWIQRWDPHIELWWGERCSLSDDLDLIRVGGHFPGGTVCRWAFFLVRARRPRWLIGVTSANHVAADHVAFHDAGDLGVADLAGDYRVAAPLQIAGGKRAAGLPRDSAHRWNQQQQPNDIRHETGNRDEPAGCEQQRGITHITRGQLPTREAVLGNVVAAVVPARWKSRNPRLSSESTPSIQAPARNTRHVSASSASCASTRGT